MTVILFPFAMTSSRFLILDSLSSSVVEVMKEVSSLDYLRLSKLHFTQLNIKFKEIRDLR